MVNEQSAKRTDTGTLPKYEKNTKTLGSKGSNIVAAVELPAAVACAGKGEPTLITCWIC